MGPFYGWRSWIVRRDRLSSLYVPTLWPADGPLRAECLVGDTEGFRPAGWGQHAVGEDATCAECPALNCTCGIYAGTLLAEVRQVSYARSHLHLAFGIVQGWGRVVEHERGWRAEYARPVALLKPTVRLRPAGRLRPRTRRRTRETEALAEAYGIPLINEPQASEWLGVQRD
ncbi:MAG: hypothetical protein ACRDZO_22015 [Egibacteraceae bacterium]